MPQSLEEMAELKEKAEAKGYQFCIDQMKYPGYGFQYMCNIADTSDLSTLGGRQRQKAFLAGETTLADSPETRNHQQVARPRPAQRQGR